MVVVDDVVGAEVPHMTKGVMVIVTRAPSGPVTIATVCQCVLLRGNDERSSTLRSA